MLNVLALALTLHAAAPRPALAAGDSLRTDDEVRQTVLRHASDVRGCYEREGLKRNPGLRGSVEVELTILPTGTVSKVDLTGLSLSGDGTREVSSCILTVARNWRFERGPFVVETIVFPFRLVPDDPNRVPDRRST